VGLCSRAASASTSTSGGRPTGHTSPAVQSVVALTCSGRAGRTERADSASSSASGAGTARPGRAPPRTRSGRTARRGSSAPPRSRARARAPRAGRRRSRSGSAGARPRAARRARAARGGRPGRRARRTSLRAAPRVTDGRRPSRCGRVTTRRPIGSRGVPELSEVQSNAVRELLRVSPVAVELGERFAGAGHALHLVGGSVRDALLGRLGDDLDFTTDARPSRSRRSSTAGPRRRGRPASPSARSACSAPASGSRSPPTGPRRTTARRATRR
jgi:hypothetical protein